MGMPLGLNWFKERVILHIPNGFLTVQNGVEP
jgi:hypothetical protein